MTKAEFLEKLAKLLDEFEKANDNFVVICDVSIPTGNEIGEKENWAWTGEQMTFFGISSLEFIE